MQTSVKIDGKAVQLPFDWNDLTVQQYVCLKQNKQSFEILADLSGIPVATCKQVNEQLINSILTPVATLLNSEIPVYEVEEVGGVAVPAQLGLLQFARKVNADNAVKKLNNEFFLLKLAAIYLAAGTDDEDIAAMEQKLLTENFVKVISAGHKLLSNYVLLCKSEGKIPAPNYEPEEISAGIKEFQKFGAFGLVRQIALRYGVTVETVYNWPYNRVLLELKISAEESKYERKLRNILSKKK